MQRLCTLVPATLLLTALLSPTLAVCAWIGLVMFGNALYAFKLALMAKRLIVATAIAGPLMFVANASALFGVLLAVGLAVAARWKKQHINHATEIPAASMSDSAIAA